MLTRSARVCICDQSYCYFWDVQMDWGLLVPDASSAFGYRLRETRLVTSKKWVYAALCIFNFCLRCMMHAPQSMLQMYCHANSNTPMVRGGGRRFIWSLAVFNAVPGRGGGMFFFESVEILSVCMTLERYSACTFYLRSPAPLLPRATELARRRFSQPKASHCLGNFPDRMGGHREGL